MSEENLAEFTRFFLTTCIDQVTFMEGLMQPDQLRARILLWAEEQIRLDRLPPKSGAVLEALLYRGELPRGDAAAIVGTGERQARRVVSALIEQGVLISESTARPCVSPSPPRSPRAGCRDCFRTDLRKVLVSKDRKKAAEEGQRKKQQREKKSRAALLPGNGRP